MADTARPGATRLPPAPDAAPVPAVVHYLHPGDVAIASRGDQLITLVASCIALILTDPARTTGAMCHIVHSGQRPPSPAICATSVAEPAIEALYAMLRQAHLTPQRCEAFMYGGGNLLSAPADVASVGVRNTDAVRRRLAIDGISIVDEDVGGAVYRKVSWHVGAGLPTVIAAPVSF